MKKPIRSFSDKNRIMTKCFPFYFEDNKYVCLCHTGRQRFRTSESGKAFSHAYLFFLDCLMNNEDHQEYFHDMIIEELQRKGLPIKPEKKRTSSTENNVNDINDMNNDINVLNEQMNDNDIENENETGNDIGNEQHLSSQKQLQNQVNDDQTEN